MSPKLVSDDGRHVVIRPSVRQGGRPGELRAAARFPIIPCDLCGSQEHLQRRQMREMLAEWERRYPGALRRSSTRWRAWCLRT